jgi:ribosomal-protein-alanine N-acetyltransferase
VTVRRVATEVDLPALVALDAEVFGTDAWSERSWRAELDPATRHVEVLLGDDGGLLAYVVVRAVADVADLQRIATAPSARGGGLARGLLDAALAAARARGCVRMLLEVEATNTAARRLYVRAGFEAISRRRGYYGPGRDALVLQLSW